MSGACGVGAGLCFARAQGNWPLLGGVLLILAMIFDCADGQLARLKGGSQFGRLWDGFVDWSTALALHLGLWGYFAINGVHLFGRVYSGSFPAFLVALTTGVSLAIHSMLFDYYKNRYLALTGDGQSETEPPEVVRERFVKAQGIGWKVAWGLYYLYCKSQAGLAGKQEAGGLRPPSPELAAIRRHHLGNQLRLAGHVGPTFHLVVISVSALLAGRFAWGFYVYVFFAVVYANLFMVILFWATKRIEARLAAEERALEDRAR
jgi:hypothetical protein